jgi:multidrug transporter EmrE-like cation transporter
MSPHALAYVLGAVALVVTGQTLLKLGMNRVGPIGRQRLRTPVRLAVDVASVPVVWAGLILYALSAALWVLALATVPLSIAYPFLGLSYVFIAGVSVIALGEWLTPAQWLGILLVVFGVITVALTA